MLVDYTADPRVHSVRARGPVYGCQLPLCAARQIVREILHLSHDLHSEVPRYACSSHHAFYRLSRAVAPFAFHAPCVLPLPGIAHIL